LRAWKITRIFCALAAGPARVSPLKAQPVVRPARQRPTFTSGDKIHVAEGAFATCLGLYEGMAESEQVAILLDMFDRKVRAVFEGDVIPTA
jgi:transcription antitermination factor NusG